MPAYARSEIIDELSVGMYHCINRCVRRSFLCGEDAVSGRNFDHRKQWLENRIGVLAKIFAIEIAFFAVMDNHIHVVVINRPDHAQSWDDNEIAERWWSLYPRKGSTQLPEELKQLWLADPAFIAERRSRLSCISWFMRCLCEPLAKIANREDKVTGRFWEGRFKSIKVLDPEAAIETGIYVDLNPIKAGTADSIESSAHTSIAQRVEAVMHNAPPSLAKPVKEILKIFAVEAPFLLEDERDYIAIVRLRARELQESQQKAAEHRAYFAAFPTAIGSAASLRLEAIRRKRKWLKGISRAR